MFCNIKKRNGHANTLQAYLAFGIPPDSSTEHLQLSVQLHVRVKIQPYLTRIKNEGVTNEFNFGALSVVYFQEE